MDYQIIDTVGDKEGIITMQIAVNDTNEIVNYATVGGIGGNGITYIIDRAIIPNGFFEDYEKKKYLYVNGEVLKNYDFIPDYPSEEIPYEPLPSPTDELEERFNKLVKVLEQKGILEGIDI